MTGRGVSRGLLGHSSASLGMSFGQMQLRGVSPEGVNEDRKHTKLGTHVCRRVGSKVQIQV